MVVDSPEKTPCRDRTEGSGLLAPARHAGRTALYTVLLLATPRASPVAGFVLHLACPGAVLIGTGITARLLLHAGFALPGWCAHLAS